MNVELKVYRFWQTSSRRSATPKSERQWIERVRQTFCFVSRTRRLCYLRMATDRMGVPIAQFEFLSQLTQSLKKVLLHVPKFDE